MLRTLAITTGAFVSLGSSAFAYTYAIALAPGGDVNVTTTPGASGFAAADDKFDILSPADRGSLRFYLADDSVTGIGNPQEFGADNFGIIGFPQTNDIFAVGDTENGDNSGAISATWSFDISAAPAAVTGISIDFAAMGDFETADVHSIAFGVDAPAATTIYTNSVDEAGSLLYTLASGNTSTQNDPMLVNGVQLNNDFQSILVPLSNLTGSTLNLTLTSLTNGGGEAFAIQNIAIQIPEPSRAVLLGFGVCAVLLRRRR